MLQPQFELMIDFCKSLNNGKLITFVIDDVGSVETGRIMSTGYFNNTFYYVVCFENSTRVEYVRPWQIVLPNE